MNADILEIIKLSLQNGSVCFEKLHEIFVKKIIWQKFINLLAQKVLEDDCRLASFIHTQDTVYVTHNSA